MLLPQIRKPLWIPSMQGMNGVPAQPVAMQKPVKEAVEELPDNNLELSDKSLDDGALASLSAMFGDDEDD